MSVTGLTEAVEISVGDDHACARLTSGSVVCWGSNRDGQLGDGSMVHDTCNDGELNFDCSKNPVIVGGVTDAVEIAAGDTFTCARTARGKVVCWGAENPGLVEVPL
jgi:alpha-tubulin suppressor-like RCC1 family protein